jgi:hypothetical protein
MSSVIPVRIKGKFYFYLSSSFRDKNTGKPTTKRKYIGALDSDNRLVLNEFYLNYIEENNLILEIEIKKIYSKLAEKGITSNIPADENKVVFPYNNANNGINFNLLNKSHTLTTSELDNLQLLNLGVGHFLDNICNNIGLKDSLKNIFPVYWDKILMLLYFLIDSDESYTFCESWIDKHVSYVPKSELTSQQIDRLLYKITYSDIIKFQEEWFKYNNEHEYYVYDIISPSSYSNLIDFTETGYARERDIIPELKICLVIGESSRLPLYRVTYPEAPLEVATLLGALEADPILQTNNCKLVLDKGFYSLNTIDYLIRADINKQFLLPFPYSINFSTHILKNKIDLSKHTNRISCGSDTFYADTETINWNNDTELYKYCYYNENIHVDTHQALVQKAQQLIEIIKTNQVKKIFLNDIKKYLIIPNINHDLKDQNITINYETIRNEIKYLGWLVILSNRKLEVNSIINYYRARDVIEKESSRFLERLSNQSVAFNSPENVEAKSFIIFVANIIQSHIETVMYRNNLHDKYTLKGMLKILSQITLKIIKNRSFLNELTRDQKEIFSSFQVPAPTRDSRLA